jgi:hypothetical protein
MMLLNMHENGSIRDDDPWNNQYFTDLRRRHLKGEVLWPCRHCVERVGVAPVRVAKSNSSFRVASESKRIGTRLAMDTRNEAAAIADSGERQSGAETIE